MPKYDRLQQFMREWRKLTSAQQQQFEAAWRAIAVALSLTKALPPPPLVQKMSGQEIYEVRWAPDGRATFHIEHDANGEQIIVWRRIGDHSILKHP
jgi:hypothetical protein